MSGCQDYYRKVAAQFIIFLDIDRRRAYDENKRGEAAVRLGGTSFRITWKSKLLSFGSDLDYSRGKMPKIQVTVKTSAVVAGALHRQGPPTASSKKLLKTIETFGLTLEPLHRDTESPDLQTYFVIKVPNQATAQRVMERLWKSEAVEAAYVKPPDELP